MIFFFFQHCSSALTEIHPRQDAVALRSDIAVLVHMVHDLVDAKTSTAVAAPQTACATIVLPPPNDSVAVRHRSASTTQLQVRHHA